MLRATTLALASLVLLQTTSCSSDRPAASSGGSGSATSSPSASAIASSPGSARGVPPSAPQTPAPVALGLDLGGLARDQPPNGGLMRWGGDLVVRTSHPRRIDLASMTSSPLAIDGADQVLGLSTWAGKPVALVIKNKERYLAVKDGARVDLPPALRPVATTSKLELPLSLAADGTWLALHQRGTLHVYDGKAWRELPIIGIPEGPATMGLIATDTLLHRGKLYLAFDRGEWGGALYAVDLTTGKAEAQPGPDLPLRDLTLSPTGELWAVRGLAHLSLLEGDLRELSGTQWKLHAASEPGAGAALLPKTSLDALAFDGAGAPVLLSGAQGLLRRAPSGAWEPLLTGWPRFVYVQDLELSEGRAVIATDDAGLVVVDLATGKAGRVVLK
jgi:hypothetical protein